MIPPTWIIGGVMAVTIAGGGWFILHQRETIGQQALQIDIAEARAVAAIKQAEQLAASVQDYQFRLAAADATAQEARDSIAAARRRVSAARVSGGDAAAAQEAANALAGAFGGGQQ